MLLPQIHFLTTRKIIRTFLLLLLLISTIFIIFGANKHVQASLVSVTQNKQTEPENGAAILTKHISDLNNSSSVNLNQADKDKFILFAIWLNYLIVVSLASIIILRTRENELQSKKVFTLRNFPGESK